MPEPRPERNPGETLSAYTERLQEWAAQQNAPAATKPGGGGPAPIPAGFVQGPTPGQILRTDGFAGMTLNPATGQYEADKYAPSAATLAAAGLSKGGGSGGGGGTSFTPFPTSNQRRDAEQTALGAIKTPPDTWYIHPAGARAVDTVSKAIYTRDSGTGNWTTNGAIYNPRGSDVFWVTQAARDKGQGVGPASTPSANTAAGRAMQPLDPLATPLNPNQGPTFNSPLFSQGFRAGAMPTFQEGMIRGGNAATNALNALTVQSRSMQGNGPVVQGAASMGNGRGNIEFTRGGQGTSRTVAADRQFDPISFYVPGSYNPQTSRDNDGVFRPVDVAYNIASPTLDPLAGGGLNTGGAAYMTLSGPQTAHINDMSTGFNPNAMAHSNIGLAYGRDFSGLDSVSQMVATAALMNDREQLAALGYGPLAAMEAMTAASPSTWEGDGPGFRGFARGGTVIALDPLGGTPRYANGGSMVTSGVKYLIDGKTGKVEAIMGEDNADRDRLPDRELLRFSGPANSRLDITPLDPPRTFAEGGVVQARTPYINPQGVIQDFDAAIDFPDGPGDWTPYTAPTPTITNPVAPTPITNPVAPTPTATTPTALPIDPGGVYLNPTSPTAPLIDPLTGQSGFGAGDPAGGFEGTPSPADEFIDPPATVPVGAPRPIDPLANFDVNNPNILAPWQKAAQDLAVMAHRRRTIDDPRRRAGGMGASTGLEVLQGDVPATGLPPGMFYDPSGQVTRVISDIIGSQDALRALGPEEDVSPAYEAVTSIGNALDDMARIRQLEDARVAATAEATAEQLYASNAALDLWGQLQDLGGLLEQMKQAMGPNSNPLQRPDPAEMQALQGRYNAMLNAYNSASLTAGTPLGDAQGNIRLATIDAQLASIRGRLPVGKNEASLRTDLAREQLKIAKNDKRIGLKQQVAYLAKVGVPSLSAPIKPLDPLAAAA